MKYITRKAKSKGKRISHIWDSYKSDTYCRMKSTRGLLISNYWFKESDKAPVDVCLMCQNRRDDEVVEQDQTLDDWETHRAECDREIAGC